MQTNKSQTRPSEIGRTPFCVATSSGGDFPSNVLAEDCHKTSMVVYCFSIRKDYHVPESISSAEVFMFDFHFFQYMLNEGP